MRYLFGPLHQGVPLLLCRHLELALQVGPQVGPARLRLEFLTKQLGLQDPLGRHVGWAEAEAAVQIVLAAASAASPAVTSLLLDGLPLHAHGDALVVAAELASVPLSLVHQTVLVLTAGVGQLLTHCSLEETLEIHQTFLLRSLGILQVSGNLKGFCHIR